MSNFSPGFIVINLEITVVLCCFSACYAVFYEFVKTTLTNSVPGHVGGTYRFRWCHSEPYEISAKYHVHMHFRCISVGHPVNIMAFIQQHSVQRRSAEKIRPPNTLRSRNFTNSSKVYMELKNIPRFHFLPKM